MSETAPQIEAREHAPLKCVRGAGLMACLTVEEVGPRAQQRRQAEDREWEHEQYQRKQRGERRSDAKNRYDEHDADTLERYRDYSPAFYEVLFDALGTARGGMNRRGRLDKSVVTNVQYGRLGIFNADGTIHTEDETQYEDEELAPEEEDEEPFMPVEAMRFRFSRPDNTLAVREVRGENNDEEAPMTIAVISELDSKVKFSGGTPQEEFRNCIGLVGRGVEKQTGKRVSFLGHINIEHLLESADSTPYYGAKVRQLVEDAFQELGKKCDNIEVLAFGGFGDANSIEHDKDYRAALAFMSETAQANTGTPLEVIRGMTKEGDGTSVVLDTEKGRLHIVVHTRIDGGRGGELYSKEYPFEIGPYDGTDINEKFFKDF